MTKIDTRLRASRIRDLIAAENEAWDRATERPADAEYALEQFEESQDRQDLSEDAAEERREQMRIAICAFTDGKVSPLDPRTVPRRQRRR